MAFYKAAILEPTPPTREGPSLRMVAEWQRRHEEAASRKQRELEEFQRLQEEQEQKDKLRAIELARQASQIGVSNVLEDLMFGKDKEDDKS